MSRILGTLLAVVSIMLGASIGAQQPPQQRPQPQQQGAAAPQAPIPAGLPEWAYAPPVPGAGPAPSALPTDNNVILKIPGSLVTLTRGQVRGVLEIPDWFPNEHGPMPTIVRYGRSNEDARACGFCHLADGGGRPENAPVSGLHPAYFLQQMEDFKNGLRRSADPRKANTNNMIRFATNLRPDEARSAAEYFAQQPHAKQITVIERNEVPKTRLQGGMHMTIQGEGAGTEPIGDRIVEVPDDAFRAEARDTHISYTAYVPVGSLAAGRAVVEKYNCAVCHGRALEGNGPIPPIAGRSPSYTMRQLFDMKAGTRKGPWAEVMKPIVQAMSVKDLMNVSAYAASLDPGGRGAAGTR